MGCLIIVTHAWDKKAADPSNAFSGSGLCVFAAPMVYLGSWLKLQKKSFQVGFFGRFFLIFRDDDAYAKGLVLRVYGLGMMMARLRGCSKQATREACILEPRAQRLPSLLFGSPPERPALSPKFFRGKPKP